ERRVLLRVTDFVLRDEEGNAFLAMDNLPPIELFSPTGFDNICIWVWVDIEASYPFGLATAELAIADEVGGQSTSLAVPFSIVEDQAQPDGGTPDGAPPLGTIGIGEQADGELGEGEAHEYAVELEAGVSYIF